MTKLGIAVESRASFVLRQPEFWNVAYHTLFFLDLYLSESPEGFAPPAPFTLAEFDPSGVLPERVYSKAELEAYLAHCRRKFSNVVGGLTEENAPRAPRIQIGQGNAC